MIIKPDTGLIASVKQVTSPNHDARPDNLSPEVIIIHAISLPPGEFGGPFIEKLFCNQLDANDHESFHEICDLEVSAHVLIRRDGEIIQFVPLTERAWHAGESVCEGRTRVNDFSIGIELEGCDDSPFTEIQYKVLADLTNEIISKYPKIDRNRIYGHAEISPGRKTDPGPYFQWDKFRSLLFS